MWDWLEPASAAHVAIEPAFQTAQEGRAAELTCSLFLADDVETALAWARVTALAMWRYMSAMPALPTYTHSFLMPSERDTPSSMTCMMHEVDR